jgi:Tol biopolymer transport system component
LVPPTTGTIEVTTSTGGTEQDADGYTLQIGEGSPEAIGAAATLTVPDISPGSYRVLLGGVNANCSLAGDNPRTVNVLAGETATLAFAVTCIATTGSLSISAVTSGPSPDGDGYAISIDGTDRGALGVNGAAIITEIPPGNHVVGLSGVAANCQIQGDNLRAVTIVAGAEGKLAYTIVCGDPPPEAGSLRLTTSTDGPDPDPDGYTFAVDGGTDQPISATGTTTLTNVSAGDHNVQLGAVAGNCTLQGTNPRSVTVSGGATANVSFAITCVATAGTIRVSVTTEGSPTDPDGYVAKLDAADSGKSIPTTGSVSFTGVLSGDHAVTLTGLADNCGATGGPLRNITVAVGATVEVGFVVTCSPTTGTIQVVTITTGESLDPDGYTVQVDAGVPQRVGLNTTLTLENVPLGTHVLRLAGTAHNCHLKGEHPRTVVLFPGSTTVSLAINCLGASALIAFTSNETGVAPNIYVVHPDGTGLRNLSQVDAHEVNPIWSPAGDKILFTKNGDLYVMDPDGAGRVKLAEGRTSINEYRWSPDGQMIAYADLRLGADDFSIDLWVMQVDGNRKVKLVEQGDQPSWSPDGRIVYRSRPPASDRLSPTHLRVVNADGRRDVRLTTRAGYEPVWSPDGGKIAFVGFAADFTSDIYVINPDGTREMNLTQGLNSLNAELSWSPDGSKIAFSTAPVGPVFHDIAVMNRDGTGRTNLTNEPGFDHDPSWSPDGTKIAYVRSRDGNADIYVMNSDGTAKTKVSNLSADDDETRPDWNGWDRSGLLAGRPPKD